MHDNRLYCTNKKYNDGKISFIAVQHIENVCLQILRVIYMWLFYVLLTFYGNELLFEGALQAFQATNNPQKRTMLKILHMGNTLVCGFPLYKLIIKIKGIDFESPPSWLIARKVT